MSEKFVKALMHSILLSKSYDEDNYDIIDIINFNNIDVCNCQINLYLKVIEMLSKGISYDEILEFITNYSSDEFNKLKENEKVYIKCRTRKDVINRKNNLEGEDKYE